MRSMKLRLFQDLIILNSPHQIVVLLLNQLDHTCQHHNFHIQNQLYHRLNRIRLKWAHSQVKPKTVLILIFKNKKLIIVVNFFGYNYQV